MGAQEVVVLDTNVLVSALGWNGAERRVYRACRRGTLQMATSHPLLTELGRVLMYEKFSFAKGEIKLFFADICSHALVVSPAEVLTVVSDDDDNRAIECALAANARWLVSGDRHLLALRRYRGIRIENAGKFLASLSG